jgi:hypothetical protein
MFSISGEAVFEAGILNPLMEQARKQVKIRTGILARTSVFARLKSTGLIAWHGKIACLNNFPKPETMFRSELHIGQNDFQKFNFLENAHFGLSPFHKPITHLGG